MSNPDPIDIHHRLELLHDAGWRAALTIFSSPLLAHRGEVWASIDLDERSIDMEKLLFESGVLSGGEQRMVDLALSLFNQQRHINLWKILAGLDEENAELAADAVRNFSAGPMGLSPLKHGEAIRKVLAEKPVRRRKQS